MNNEKTPDGILVRKPQFEFPKDFPTYWNPAEPEWSQMFNGASMILPYFEPFMIDAMREATKQIDDPDLLQEAKAWMGQESQHFRQHRRFNDMVIAKGYEQLREVEQQMDRSYKQLAQRPLKFQLAYSAGIETMALAMGHAGIAQRESLFGNADPAIASLWLWHFVEEIEHKNLAFDVYQRLYGNYWYRVYGMLYALTHTFALSRRAYITLLKTDGWWGKWRTRWAIKRLALRLFAVVLPRLVLHGLPWHHPSKVTDPAWMQEWVALYDQGEKGLLTLDTTKMQMSPAGMLPT